MAQAINRYDQPYTFIVEGVGEFPFDMLRHSSAHPVDGTSASAMGMRGKRRVALTAATLRYIVPARWASFGWPIVEGFDEHGFDCPIDDFTVGPVASVKSVEAA